MWWWWWEWPSQDMQLSSHHSQSISAAGKNLKQAITRSSSRTKLAFSSLALLYHSLSSGLSLSDLINNVQWKIRTFYFLRWLLLFSKARTELRETRHSVITIIELDQAGTELGNNDILPPAGILQTGKMHPGILTYLVVKPSHKHFNHPDNFPIFLNTN